MIDLDNLRQEGWPDAADEIERLRADNKRLCAAVNEALRVTGLNFIAAKVVELHALVNGQGTMP